MTINLFIGRSISYKWRINFQNNSLSNRGCVLVSRLDAIRVLFYQISSVIREIFTNRSVIKFHEKGARDGITFRLCLIKNL